MLLLFGAYLWIVYKAGPKFMKNRRPYQLTNITRLYNLYQIAVCSYFVYAAFENGFSFFEVCKCVPEPKYVGHLDETEMRISYYQWWCILLRLSEFLETIFFILRKKFNQVSMLHVYHHISVPFLLWVSLKYSSSRMELFLIVLNSLVHVIMYSYYFLCSFQKLQKYTKLVKSLITAIQIIQLLIFISHCFVAMLPGCHATWVFYIHFINIFILVFMFMKFYSDSYLKGKRSDTMKSH